MLLVKLMGLLDIVAGFFLISGTDWPIIKFFVFYSLLKGISSLISSIALSYYYDWMGLIDLLAGIGLFLLNSGYPYGVFVLVGYASVLKGIYSLFIG